MKAIFNLFIRTLAVLITAYLIPGIKLESFLTALVVVVVLGVLNTIIKPILVVLTLPVNVLSLGLFTLVINGFIIFLAASLVPGFYVSSFLTGVIFSLVLSLVNWFLNSLKN